MQTQLAEQTTIVWPSVYQQVLRRSDPFREWIERGYVKRTLHPTLPLALYEYTAKAQFDHVWDPMVRVARGLIVEYVPSRPDRIRRIVANPFPRFANLDEIEETRLDQLPSELYVSEKLDGSLIIVWHYLGRWYFSTRGGFASRQAQAAEAWYRKMGLADPPDTSCTYLFEWISPDNRIVVDYKDRQELVLLAVRRTATGEEDPPERLPIVASYIGVRAVPMRRLFEAVKDLPFGPPDQHEGYVLYSHKPYLRVKVKSPAWVMAHRILHHLSPAQVVEWAKTGVLPEEVLRLPPSLLSPIEQAIMQAQAAYEDLMAQAKALVHRTAHLSSRKEKALATEGEPKAVRTVFFALLDGNEERASEIAWAMVERSGGQPSENRV